jgi:TonB-dependent SusC/RagA subfamily outer membrane receptor
MALILPLIIIRYTVVNDAPIQNELSLSLSEAATAYFFTDTSFVRLCKLIFASIYLAVFAALFTAHIVGIARLCKIIRQNDVKRFVGYKMISSSEIKDAFSFLNYMFIPERLTDREKQIILKHEKTHVQQKHWVDLLLAHALRLVWWFNPVMLFYEKAIRANHEFLSDREVLSTTRLNDYQNTLFNQWFKIPDLLIIHSFSNTNNLKRLSMMKKNISNPLKKLFALLAIPACALFLVAFAEKEIIFTVTGEKTVVLQDSLNSELQLAFRNIGKDKPLILVDSKEVENIDRLNPNDIESISVLKDNAAVNVYGEKGKNGVILVTTKRTAAIESKPEATKTTPASVDSNHLKNYVNGINSFSGTNKPLVIVDGQEVSNIDDIRPDDIKSISVLKESSSVNIYGEKGKNGVILITLKK